MLDLAVATRAETFERIRGPLGERGIRVRHVRAKERAFHLTQPSAEFDGFDVGYVYPSRLMEGGVVDVWLGVPWVNGREAVITSRNKAGVLATLASAGVPVPETTMLSNPVGEAEVVEAFEALGAPVVVKPNSATRGIGVAKVNDVDSLLGLVDYVDLIHGIEATGDRAFLLQAYLPDARDYRVMVIDGDYVGAVERRFPGERADRWKLNVHRDAEAVSVDLPPELRELAELTARVLGIDLLGVDLLVTDDRAVVTETNARPTIDDPAKYEAGFYDRLAALIRSTAGPTA